MGDKKFHFPRVSPKVNVMVRLEFKLATTMSLFSSLATTLQELSIDILSFIRTFIANLYIYICKVLEREILFET